MGGAAPGWRRRCWPSSGSARPPPAVRYTPHAGAASASSRRPRSPARSTGSGGARPTRRSPRARATPPGSRASPRPLAWSRTPMTGADSPRRRAGRLATATAPPDARSHGDGGVRRCATTVARRRGARPPSRRRARGPLQRRPVADGRPAGRHRVRHPRARRARGRRPHRARPHAPSSPPAAPSSSTATRCPASTADALADALVPVARTPLGPLAGRPAAGRHRPAPTGSPSWTSSCPWPAATSRAAPPRCSASSPRCCARHLPADDPLARYADLLAARRSPTSRCAATSPAASTRCCGCPARRYVVVDYKTNWLGPIRPSR